MPFTLSISSCADLTWHDLQGNQICKEKPTHMQTNSLSVFRFNQYYLKQHWNKHVLCHILYKYTWNEFLRFAIRAGSHVLPVQYHGMTSENTGNIYMYICKRVIFSIQITADRDNVHSRSRFLSKGDDFYNSATYLSYCICIYLLFSAVIRIQNITRLHKYIHISCILRSRDIILDRQYVRSCTYTKWKVL